MKLPLRIARRWLPARSGRRQRRRGDLLAAGLDERIGGHDVQIRARGSELPERLEPLGQVDVVGIQQDDELAARRSRGRVLGRALAAVLLAQVDDSVAERLEHERRAVGRAVIADDDLVRRDRLCERRLDRGGDEPLDLVGSDQDPERRHRPALDLSRGRRSDERRREVGHASEGPRSSSNSR